MKPQGSGGVSPTQWRYGGGLRGLAVLAIAVLRSVALSASLQEEAQSLRAKLLANAGLLTALDLETVTDVQRLDSAGVGSGPAESAHESVAWVKGAKKLRWKNLAKPPRAYFADGTARTLEILGDAGASAYVESLTDDEVDRYTTPFPRWLWRPDVLVPKVASSVREENKLLVLVSSAKHPQRSIWLDRDTGLIAKFSETDATGRVVRVVACSKWTSQSGVWYPGQIDETIRGRKAGAQRVVKFSAVSVNPSLPDARLRLW